MIDPRERRSERFNKARAKLELRRSTRPAITVVAFLALMVVLAGYTLSKVSPNSLSSTEQVRFAVGDVTAVQPGINEVRFKGVPIGTISKIELPDDGQPVLVATIRRKYGPVYRDVRAQLRPNTALQDIYLDIVDRGHASAGEAGDTPIPAARTELPVNLADVLDTFGPNQRVRLRTLLDELGNGMADRGTSLRAAFVTTAPFVEAAARVAHQLAGRRPQVRRLVHNTAVLTRELGRREQQLRTLMRDGGDTLQALRESSPDLNATLAELPRLLSSIDTSFAATSANLPAVDGALRRLAPVAGSLPAALTALRRLGAELDPAVAALRTPVTRLVPLSDQLAPTSADLDRVVDALRPQIDTVDKVVRDLADCRSGIQGFFQWNASISKFGDARGPIPRGNVVVGAQSSGLFNDPNEYAPAACTPGRPIGGRVPEAKDKH